MKNLFLIFISWHHLVYAQQWEARTSIPEAGNKGRWSPVCFSINSKIYVGGGYIGNFISKKDFWEYDTETDSWKQKADIPGSQNRTAAIAFSINGLGYVGLGAEAYNTIDYMFLKDLWSYNPITDVWMQMASLPDSARSGASCFVVNNKVYVVGGQTGFPQASADLWMYDPQSDQWTAKQSLPHGPIYGAMAFALDDNGYIVGGIRNSDSGLVNTPQLWKYSTVADVWERKSDYCDSKGRDNGVAMVINGKAIVGLGKAKDGATTYYYKEFCRYSPETDVWEAFTEFKGIDRAHAIGIAVNNKAYAGAGFLYLNEQKFYNDWWELKWSTSLLSNPEPEQIQVYPNPTHGYMRLGNKQSGDKVQILNLQGKVILESESDEYDMSDFPSGIYLIKILNNQESVILKLCKY